MPAMQERGETKEEMDEMNARGGISTVDGCSRGQTSSRGALLLDALIHGAILKGIPIAVGYGSALKYGRCGQLVLAWESDLKSVLGREGAPCFPSARHCAPATGYPYLYVPVYYKDRIDHPGCSRGPFEREGAGYSFNSHLKSPVFTGVMAVQATRMYRIAGRFPVRTPKQFSLYAVHCQCWNPEN